MKKRKLSKEIKKWIKFLKKDCNDQNWDWAFIIRMEIEKLTQVADFLEKHGSHVNAKHDASRIRLAIRLATIAMHEETEEISYVNFRNVHRFTNEEQGRILTEWYTIKDKLKAFNCTVDCKEIAEHDLRVEKAWYLYNKLRYIYLRTWWD